MNICQIAIKSLIKKNIYETSIELSNETPVYGTAREMKRMEVVKLFRIQQAAFIGIFMSD